MYQFTSIFYIPISNVVATTNGQRLDYSVITLSGGGTLSVDEVGFQVTSLSSTSNKSFKGWSEK